MDLLTTLRVVLRRWRVVLPALVVCGVLLFFFAISLPATYRASGDLVIVPADTLQSQAGEPVPPDSPDPVTVTAANPLVRVGEFELLGRVLISEMNQNRTRERLLDDGVTTEWTFAYSEFPVLRVAAEGADAQVVLDDVALVSDAAVQELETLQITTGARSTSQLLRLRPLGRDIEATALYGSKIRVLAGVAALGLAASLGLAFVAEGIAVERERRRARRLAPYMGWAETDLPPPEHPDGAGDAVPAPVPVPAVAGAVGAPSPPEPSPADHQRGEGTAPRPTAHRNGAARSASGSH